MTKAGASAYHGSFNFVFRDNRFNAREPFAVTKPQEQRRIFETSLTGPLGSGKTSSFLFTGTYQSESAESIVYAIGPSGVTNTALVAGVNGDRAAGSAQLLILNTIGSPAHPTVTPTGS